MRFEWNDKKARQNLLKHGVRFETAVLVFDDPYMLVERDPTSGDEERWNTLGSITQGMVLFVVHTWLEVDSEEVVRIISARAAESRERKKYEEAQQGAKAGHRQARRYEGRGH